MSQPYQPVLPPDESTWGPSPLLDLYRRMLVDEHLRRAMEAMRQSLEPPKRDDGSYAEPRDG
jgi:hypothetical protein